MTLKSLHKKIKRRKLLLNILLTYFKPTNKFIVFLSEDLDILILKAQKIKAKKYYKNNAQKSKENDCINKKIA
ncbi:hypothetical protein [Clostridium tarantellae]|uniref:Spo0E family sporulation regulatory protein-aspartic acid phosphatase n=1 Tax=Clostridium tarantellae TaxID=39493 RepID=A0A6I1MLI1_9CLOT|nr:hypothetical protein [Clostridium tarantellae]MPQ43278.1 hypothetical protein [Clostridium tarantellae]